MDDYVFKALWDPFGFTSAEGLIVLTRTENLFSLLPLLAKHSWKYIALEVLHPAI